MTELSWEMADKSFSELQDDQGEGIDGGIAMKFEALEADLFHQSVQMRRRESRTDKSAAASLWLSRDEARANPGIHCTLEKPAFQHGKVQWNRNFLWCQNNGIVNIYLCIIFLLLSKTLILLDM